MRNDRVGIFVGSAEEARDTLCRLTADHDTYLSSRGQMTVKTACTDYTILLAEDTHKYAGMVFDAVQISSKVKAEYFPFIMARCRSAVKYV